MLLDRVWGQFERNRAWKRADHSHPEGLRWDFAWRSRGSRSGVGSGVRMVVGLVLIGVVLIGVCGVLLVGWLLWLFCDVGVWLLVGGMGMTVCVTDL